MTHCKYCPQCAEQMEWKGSYYYCETCKITQYPYSTLQKIILGIAIITIIFTFIFY